MYDEYHETACDRAGKHLRPVAERYERDVMNNYAYMRCDDCGARWKLVMSRTIKREHG